jgi:P-type Ca2+ transporter type 2C
VRTATAGVQAIHIAVPGRARYRIVSLYRSTSLGRLLEQQLSRIDGINSVSANPLTGTVLVFFNSDRSTADIAALVEEVVGTRDAHSAAQGPVTRPFHPAHNEQEEQEGARDRQATRRELTTAVPRRTVGKRVAHAKAPVQKPWHLITSEVVLASWRTSPASGLSSQTARDYLLTYGPNLLPESMPRSELGIFVAQLNSLPVAMLTVAAGVSLFTGGLADAVIIVGVVAMNAIIGYVTESRSEKTIHSLKHLVRPSAWEVTDKAPLWRENNRRVVHATP